MELPKEIEWNIIKFMSHPVVEIIKNSYEFKFAKWKMIEYMGAPLTVVNLMLIMGEITLLIVGLMEMAEMVAQFMI